MDSQLAVLISTIAAAVSAVFAAVSSIMTYRQYRKSQLQKLSEKLAKILEISVQYPYVENPGFTSQWENMKDSSDERYMRYDMYCNLLFNYWVDVYDYFGGNKKKIEEFVDIKNWIRLHRSNWQHPFVHDENIDAYSPKFRKFIDSYIR